MHCVQNRAKSRAPALSLAALIAVAGIAASFDTAEAARKRSNRGAAPALTVAALPAPAKATPAKPTADERQSQASQSQPYLAVVSLGAQTITVYSGTEPVAKSGISSGMSGHRTPTGVFSVLEKKVYHESNIYDGAPMPFMQRLTWSGIALHAGKLPGYPASHGCVRLPHDFAERLFKMSKVGMRVVVAPDAIAPFTMAHASLPVPVMSTVPMLAERSLPLGPGMTLASAGASATTDGVVERVLNPMQFAELERVRTIGLVADAQREARFRLEASAEKSRVAVAARDVVRAAEAATVPYRDLLARASRMMLNADGAEDRIQAEASLFAAREALEDANAVVIAARADEARASDTAFEAARAARTAEDAADKADFDARAARRALQPISVFISRKENRVLVRQGFEPIYEGEVTIEDDGRPIGTHVLTALQPADGGQSMRWSAISVPDAGAERTSASAALARITFAADAKDYIGKRLWTGATVMISDRGISNETGKGTDFVLLTK